MYVVYISLYVYMNRMMRQSNSDVFNVYTIPITVTLMLRESAICFTHLLVIKLCSMEIFFITEYDDSLTASQGKYCSFEQSFIFMMYKHHFNRLNWSSIVSRANNTVY